MKKTQTGFAHLGLIIVAVLVLGVIGFAGYNIIIKNGFKEASAAASCGNTTRTTEVNITRNGKKDGTLYPDGHGMFYIGTTAKGKPCFEAAVRVTKGKRKVVIEVYKQTSENYYTRIGRYSKTNRDGTRTIEATVAGNYKVKYYAWTKSGTRYHRTIPVTVTAKDGVKPNFK